MVNGIDCSMGERTKQCFKDECDINKLMARYAKTKVLPEFKPGAVFGDFANIDDYQVMLNKVNAAKDAFDGMPHKVRKFFNFDPKAMFEFLSDEKNRDQAKVLGLLKVEKPKEDTTPPGGGSS